MTTPKKRRLQEHKPGDKTESPPLFGDVVLVDEDFDQLETANAEFANWRWQGRDE